VRELVIGLDIGSSSTKAVLLTMTGELLASASREHASSQPQQGWQELELGLLWRECVDLIRGLIAQAQAMGGECARIGVTGLVPALCLLDSDGRPLRPAILHTDTRADEEMAEINRVHPEVHQGHLLPKLLWLRRHEEECFKEISRVLVPHSYIVYRLTGQASCDLDTATLYGAVFNRSGLRWDESACASFDLAPRILPPTYPASTLISGLSTQAAEELGLSGAAQVIVGTGDSFATMLGAGLRDPRELMLYWGGSGTRLYTQGSPSRYLDGPYFEAGRAEFRGSIFSCGESLDRFRRFLGNPPWSALEPQAKVVAPGSGGLFFIPHVKQLSCSAGFSGSDHLMGLRDYQGPGPLYRAMLEGIAYTSALGLPPREAIDAVHVCGGAAASATLRSILASLLGMSVHYRAGPVAAVGIALLAAYSGGARGDFTSLSRLWIEGSSGDIEEEPKPELSEFYREAIGQFISLRDWLHDASHETGMSRKREEL